MQQLRFQESVKLEQKDAEYEQALMSAIDCLTARQTKVKQEVFHFVLSLAAVLSPARSTSNAVNACRLGDLAFLGELHSENSTSQMLA